MPSKRIPRHIELEYIKLSRLAANQSHEDASLGEGGTPPAHKNPADILQALLKRDQYRNCLAKIVFTLGFLILIGGFGMILVFGVLYAQSYGYTLDFTYTTCNVTVSNVTGTVTCEECKYYIGECETHYPCLEILVDYQQEGGEWVRGVHLYDSHYSMRNQRSGQQCSYYTCYKDPAKNAAKIYDFQDKYGRVGDEVECYYNDHKPTEVIKGRISRLTVIVSMVFAGVTIVVGASLSVFMYVCFCRR